MKKQKVLKPRRQPACYDGLKYEDYLEFRKMNPTIPATEMDTVYNDPEGPYIQTFIFENAPVMIGFLHKEKTSASMASTLDVLQERLGEDYRRIFALLITDRGPEFEKHDLFEFNSETGEMRTDIFYCDPQMPSQKPHVENNHNYVRDIIPNGKDLRSLTQEDIDLMFSHINSVPRDSLNGKTPYDVFAFFYGEELLKKLNVTKIDKDAVTLMPYLLNIK
jgi:IS30 family transposase